MKKSNFTYTAIIGVLVLLGSATLYYQRLSLSIYHQLESERVRRAGVESSLLGKDRRQHTTERLLEECESKNDKILDPEGVDKTCDDQDLIDQLKEEVSRLENIIAEQREELQRQEYLNTVLQAGLTHGADEDSEIEIVDGDRDESEVSEQINMRLGALMERNEKYKAQRRGFFEELATAKMTDEELAVHQSVLKTMDAIEQLETSLAETTMSDDRSFLYKELSQEQQQLAGIMLEERRVALRQFARSLGYEEGEVDGFSSSIQYIVEVTDPKQPASRATSELKVFGSSRISAGNKHRF